MGKGGGDCNRAGGFKGEGGCRQAEGTTTIRYIHP